MKFSAEDYERHVFMGNNPEDLSAIHNTIDNLDKGDMIAHFSSLSIDGGHLHFLQEKGNGIPISRTILKSGYQSLLSKLGIPFRLAQSSPDWVEIPMVNGTITNLSQKTFQRNVTIRLIGITDVRAVLSSSYTAVDDKSIISLLEKSFLPRIESVSFNCDHMNSSIQFQPRAQYSWSYGIYTVNMFMYITNSEIGDASVRCGLGINISQTVNPERSLGFTFTRDTRTIGRVIHRGEAIPRLEKQLDSLFATAAENWALITNALINMSSISVEQVPNFEERIIKSLKSMPEFEIWKTQYDEMRSTSVITNVFDLIYLMTSIPYRDEHFSNIVEEIIFGRLF